MAEDTKQGVALRKRQQISSAAKMMFIWVAGASAVLGASLVVVYFLGQKAFFNEAVLAKKSETAANLQHNLDTVDELKSAVRVLNTNETLMDLQADGTTEPIGVIFDALPATANSEALGASLQGPELLGRSGITIESLNVEPINGAAGSSSSEPSTGNAIVFDFSILISQKRESELKDLFRRLERSIRAFAITELTVETQDGNYKVSVKGEGYYQPGVVVELRKEKVPNEKN